MINLKSILLALGLGAMMAASAGAQGTAFTYQGRLNNGTNLATGSYDLKFTLFATNVTGTAVGGPVTNAATAVNNGLFTVTIDFGNAFNGASNWLELAVRTNGAATFTNLAPRQQLTPVPYAIYAEGANAAGLSGTLAGNGGGLTNLHATGITGTIASSNLPANVAFLDATQTFTGENSFSGSVGIGTPPVGTVPLSVQGNSSLGDGVVEAFQNGGTTSGYGVAGYSLIPGGHGAIGESDGDLANASGPGAAAVGVEGASGSTNGTGIYGSEFSSSGVTYGVYGQVFSPQGYAGYFSGQSYFSTNVGIGVANPVDLLDVAPGAIIGNSTTIVTEHDPGNRGNKVGFGYRDPGSGDFNGMRAVVNPGTAGCGNSGDLLFYTWECNTSVSREVMRINGTGNIGIDTNNVLEFGFGNPGKEVSAGKIGYERFTPDSLDIVGAGTNVSSRKIKFWAEGGANFNGNVGIGTTTPNSPLAVFGNIFMGKQRNNTTFNQIGDTIYLGAEQKYLANTLGTPVDGSTDWINLMANPLSAGIMFGLSTSLSNPHSNNIPLMVIKANGNVGIGIGATNPATTLQVNGTISATAFSIPGSGNVALLGGGNAFTGQQTIMSGSVGIGTTTPTAHFHVNGGAFETPIAAALFEVQNCGPACSLPSWTEAVRLMNSEANLTGLVGMGFLTAPVGTSLTNVPDAWIGTDDKASGNTHSFKIATQSGGALTNRVFINGATGNMGIGTTTPAGRLSVATLNGTVNIMDGQFTPELVMTGGGADGTLRLRSRLEVWPKTNLTAAGYLDVRNTNGNATISLDGTNGNITCVAVNITSDRNAKENFAPVNARAVLEKVASLPITEWQYKQQSDTRHIGPMAQDFSSAFAVGTDNKHISVVDEGGVALAAIQGLNQKLDEKDALIQEQSREIQELRRTVDNLVTTVGHARGVSLKNAATDSNTNP